MPADLQAGASAPTFIIPAHVFSRPASIPENTPGGFSVPFDAHGSRAWIRGFGATAALAVTVAMLAWINFLAVSTIALRAAIPRLY